MIKTIRVTKMKLNVNLKSNPFILKPEEYKRGINPVQQYTEQQAQFLSIMENIPKKNALEFVKKINTSDIGLKNPYMQQVVPNEYGDRVVETTTLVDYIKETISSDHVLSATLTTFLPTKVKQSYISKFISVSVPRRSKVKKEQHKAKLLGDKVKEAFCNAEQNNIKKLNNTISGISSIATTPVYMPSMHPVLTSTCRMTSGYANANNEKLLGGNRHYYSAEITINSLITLTMEIDEERIKEVIDRHKLYVPTGDELYEVVMESARLYWRWPEKEEIIRQFLNNCNKVQRASIAFNNDFATLLRFNEHMCRSFLGGMAKITGPIEGMTIEEAQKIFDESISEIQLVGIQVYEEMVKGKPKDIYYQNEEILYIASSIINIYEVIDRHRDYIECFLRTPHMPPGIWELPNMIRKIVVNSDTDSSLFTVEKWTQWHTGTKDLSPEGNAIFAVMVMLSSLTLKHILANMSANIGVDKSMIHNIAMKNEYKFRELVNMRRTKHYMASLTYQEGVIFKDYLVEKKGVHLKNSTTPVEIINHSEEVMKRIFYLSGRDPIKIKDTLHEVANVQKGIIESVEKGKLDYFTRRQIKDKTAYKNPDSSPYWKYEFWNNTFGKIYGEAPPPPYTSYDVPVNLDSPPKLKRWLDNIQDESLKNDLINELQRLNKKQLGTINIPHGIFNNKSLPKEINEVVQKRELVTTLSGPYTLALETVGIYPNSIDSSRLLLDYY